MNKQLGCMSNVVGGRCFCIVLDLINIGLNIGLVKFPEHKYLACVIHPNFTK